MLLLLFDPKNRILGIGEVFFLIFLLKYFFKGKYYFLFKGINFYLIYFLLPIVCAIIILPFNSENISKYYIQQNIVRVLFGLSLFPILSCSKEKIENIFIKNLKRYSIFLLMIVFIRLFLIYFPNKKIESFIYYYGLNEGIFWFHIQKVFGIKISAIFSSNTLLLIFLLSYSLFKEKNKKYLLVSFFLLIQSGTSANILSAILIVSYYFYSLLLKKTNINLLKKFICFLLICIFFVIIFKKIIFKADDLGNQVKYLHLLSYIKLWKENPYFFWFGQGLGTGFYSMGFKKITYLTEIFYFEIIRIYGIAIFSVILTTLLYLLYKLIIQKREWLAISYLSYLCISGTNPYLFGVMGSFIICLIYKITLNERLTIKSQEK